MNVFKILTEKVLSEKDDLVQDMNEQLRKNSDDTANLSKGAVAKEYKCDQCEFSMISQMQFNSHK